MPKVYVHVIESEVVVREIDVAKDFDGCILPEARRRAFRGEGHVVANHPASGPVVHLDYTSWDAEIIDDEDPS